MNLMETNKKNMGMFGPNFGTADAINRMASRNAGLTLPSFADGGEGNFGSGTMVMLHGHERIIPLDKGGGGAMISAPIYITVSGGNGAQAGRDAADALLARMKQSGVKV